MKENQVIEAPPSQLLDYSKVHVSLRMGNGAKAMASSFEEDFFRGKETPERFKALVKELNENGSFKSVVWEETSLHPNQPGVVYGELDLSEIRSTNRLAKSPLLLLAIIGYFFLPTAIEIQSTATLTLWPSDSHKQPQTFRSIVSGTSYDHFESESYRKLFNEIKLRHVEKLTSNFQ